MVFEEYKTLNVYKATNGVKHVSSCCAWPPSWLDSPIVLPPIEPLEPLEIASETVVSDDSTDRDAFCFANLEAADLTHLQARLRFTPRCVVLGTWRTQLGVP